MNTTVPDYPFEVRPLPADEGGYLITYPDLPGCMSDGDTVEEAINDCAVVAATTGLKGLYRSHTKSPREVAPRLLESAQIWNAARGDGRGAVVEARRIGATEPG